MPQASQLLHVGTRERVVIEGGYPLVGEVQASGAKNAVLKLMAAALMAEGESVIRNVPDIRDVRVMMQLLEALGAAVELQDGVMRICVGPELNDTAPDVYVRQMRASVQVLGALLGRLGRATVGQPGGCAIGPRPIDLHLRGLERLGAVITETAGCIVACAKRLRGAEIHLDFPSVGATENIMMAAALADGETVIQNAAREPEVVELQNFLNKMGARISGAGTDTIRVRGVSRLKPAEHEVIPDRIEVGTFLVAGAITAGDVTVTHAISEHVQMVIAKLQDAGARLEVDPVRERIRVIGPARPRAIQVRTMPYPGFPTDMQPQITAWLTMADGTSIVQETIYADRFRYVDELRRMGADIVVTDRAAIVRGVDRLTGATVEATDLRAGAALILAGLAAEGQTVVENVHYIDRGYERFVEKLASLGARIERVS